MKYSLVLTLLLLLSASTLVQAQAPQMDPTAAGYFNRGNDKFKSNDFAAAIVLYDSALITSQDYRIYYQKGVALTRTNSFEQAISIFNECLKVKPDLDLAYNAIARAYFSLKKYDEAITAALKALEKTQNNALKKSSVETAGKSYLEIANLAIKDSNFTKGIESYKKSLEYIPEENTSYSLMKAYFDTKDYDNAIATGLGIIKNEASKIIPNTCYYLGRAYKAKGDIDNAIVNFEKSKTLPAIQPLAEKEIQILQKEKEKIEKDKAEKEKQK